MSIAPGTRFGPYTVVEPIGAGGMGEVYRATDTNLKRDVALKVLPDSLVTDTNRLARLQREAETLAALNHTNIAHIYGLERSDGRTAIVMELVDGPTLAERIARGALPATEALEIAAQIGAALEVAHEQGIVHRDLKPANVKIRADGAVKVLDFGIAKALDARAAGSGAAPALTTPATMAAGIVLGTAAYMSPEQARGKPVDKRTDVWAFGCVLYEMLTGQQAFVGDDVTTTVARVLERDPDMKPLPAGLPPAVRRTLELCLQKDPKKRLRDIGDVRLSLEGALAIQGPSVPPKPLWQRTLPVAAALVVGAAVAGAYFATRPPAVPAVDTVAAPPVTRFEIVPPAPLSLASLGGYDVIISPDGRRIAYFAEGPDRSGVSLHVRDLDELETRPIAGTEVTNVGPGNMNPFFSPDGRSIGMLVPDRGVVRVAVEGAPPVKMLDTTNEPFLGATWMADDTLIYSAGRNLQRVAASGGATPEPLNDVSPDAFVMSPVPLPGGRAVLFGRLKDGVESVAVLDLESGEEKVLIENGQNATYADTGHILFARGNALMAAPFDPAELSLVGEPVAMLQDVRHPNTNTAADYALSASGTLVYVPGDAATSARSAVVWVNRSGTVVERAVGELVDTPRDPQISPDGTRLLLVTGPIVDGDLWSYDLRGRPAIPLALPGDNRFPVWSPDSRRVIFVRAGAAADILVMPTDGSAVNAEPLRSPRQAGGPMVWTANDELLFGSSPVEPSILVTAVAAAGEIRSVVATEFSEGDGALSPDGRWLAYTSNRTGRYEIWVQGYPDGVPVRVSGGGGFEPRWSADGRELFYLQNTAMMSVAVSADDEFSFSAPTQLFDARRFTIIGDLAAKSYAVARDGRFLMLEPQAGAGATAGPARIVVVENWTEELKRRVPRQR